MKSLTRRLVSESPATWHVFYDGVLVGTLSERRGNPAGSDAWAWTCGFYPGGRKVQRQGTAHDLTAAREAFSEAWDDYLPGHTEADFAAWRRHQAFHRWKEAMHAAGLPLPTQHPDGVARCFCGATIGLDVEEHIAEAHAGPGRT